MRKCHIYILRYLLAYRISLQVLLCLNYGASYGKREIDMSVLHTTAATDAKPGRRRPSIGEASNIIMSMHISLCYCLNIKTKNI